MFLCQNVTLCDKNKNKPSNSNNSNPKNRILLFYVLFLRQFDSLFQRNTPFKENITIKLNHREFIEFVSRLLYYVDVICSDYTTSIDNNSLINFTQLYREN